MADADLELVGELLERGVRGLVVVSGAAGVGHAPVRGVAPVGELGAHLSHPVAQRHDVVEAAAGEAAQVLRGLPEMSIDARP